MALCRASGASRGARASKGVLFVVATPIGNLEDITLRALKILKQVELVAAEDTRRTAVLLRHYDIETSIVSVHEHNEHARIELITSRLAKGESVALVTDAGTPGISDPGANLVAAVRKAGFTIEPIPGASAVAAAVSVAGTASHGFTFLGFPPIRSKDRKLWFGELAHASNERLVVFFEAPHRIAKTLAELSNSVKRPIIIGREITKLHEEFVQGTPEELSTRFTESHGEFTIVVPPADSSEKVVAPVSDTAVVALFGQITKHGGFGSKRDVAREVGNQLKLTARQVYDIMERHK